MTTKTIRLHEVTPDELKESIIKDVRAELQKLAKNFKPTTPPEYLTRKETAKILKVSVVTLIDWDKKGILKAYRLGNQIRYKRSELDKALIHIKRKNGNETDK